MRRSLGLVIIFIFVCSSVCFAKEVKQYYPNGKLYSSQVYYDNGIPKGPYKFFWPNGKLKHRTLYKNGRVYKVQSWDPNGHLLSYN